MNAVAPYRMRLLGASFLVLLVAPVFGQPDTSQLRTEIALSERLLPQDETQAKTLSNLRVINRRLDIQSQLVNLLTADLTRYHHELEALQENICLLEEAQHRVKTEYIKTVRETYRHHQSQSFWLLLLSSGSLTEAYYRSQYFRAYSRYRREQLQLLAESKTLLEDQLGTFERIWKRRQRLSRSRNTEARRLAATRRLQRRLYQQLQSKAQSLRKAYHEEQARLQTLVKAAESNSPSLSTPDLASLTESFETALGELPWPYSPANSVIVETFGVSKDEFGNTIKNDGIALRVPQGARVKAVFSGKVNGVRPIPMQGTAVIVDHGSYRTVYANLAASTLQKGQWIEAGEAIGIARTDRRTQETTLKFMVHQSPNTFLDPLVCLKH